MNHELPITEAEMTMKPQTMIDLESESDQGRVVRLLEKLEDLDDVQRVYSNLNITIQEEA
jgi:transcriptional/translational regulatory protein YebC/TACO1